MALELASLHLLKSAAERLEEGFNTLPAFDENVNLIEIEVILNEVADRLSSNPPYPHPLYAGQMMKPPHAIARLAYALTIWINPNNHALEGGQASALMEKEAVAEIADMFGWRDPIGHLTSSGTIANLEALWIAKQICPEGKILASAQAHYSHRRTCEMLQLDFSPVPVDANGRMDTELLESHLKRGNVGTIVTTLGTTGLGSVDPLKEIVEMKHRYGSRIHVDASYGGYFILTDTLDPAVSEAFEYLTQVDSIAIDPHKHGLQPYGCGCILVRDPSVVSFYQHDSPYTYFDPNEVHLGQISFECSRPGAAAVALWATQKLLPLSRKGDFARELGQCHEAALHLFSYLKSDRRFMTTIIPDLDIVVWAPFDTLASAVSERSRNTYTQAADNDLHLALVELPSSWLMHHWPNVTFDQATVTCLRSCLMKANHLDWIDTIISILKRATDAAG